MTFLEETFCKQEVSGVLFIKNYIELQFEDRKIQFFAYPVVNNKNGLFLFGTSGASDAFISLIGKVVISIGADEDKYVFVFETGEKIEVKNRGTASGDTFSVISPDGIGEY